MLIFILYFGCAIIISIIFDYYIYLKRSEKNPKKDNDCNQYVMFKMHQKKKVSILGISGIENKTFIFKTLQIVHLLFGVACILILNELKNGFDKPSEGEVFYDFKFSLNHKQCGFRYV